MKKLVKKSYENSKNKINFVLDGAFAKHGNVSTACGSRFVREGWYTTQGGVEHMLFGDLVGGDQWRAKVLDVEGNLVIAEAPIPEGDAVMAAVSLDELPADKKCQVAALGDHPTLVTFGPARSTRVVTAIIELDGGKDPDLAGMGLEGEPVLVTWHPGEALPPSKPHDCKVGDILTVAEALEKGWRTAALEQSWKTLEFA